MKFRELESWARFEKREYISRARYVLYDVHCRSMQSPADRADDMALIAHYRREAFEWYKRELKARRQAERRKRE